MRDYIDDKNLFDACQQEFMAKRPAVTNLLAHDVKLIDILNSGNLADLFMLHFPRAFDKAHHKKSPKGTLRLWNLRLPTEIVFKLF